MAEASRHLTEGDVARMLRCAPQKVRKLRRDGLLAFTPGRPALTAEADLVAYLDTVKVRARVPVPAPPAAQEILPPADIAAARALARKNWIKRKLAAA